MVLKEISPIEKEPLKIMELPDPVPEKRNFSKDLCLRSLPYRAWWNRRKTPTKTSHCLGHQIIGRVDKLGQGATKFNLGDRVGIAWINSACGKCHFCRDGKENLCMEFQGTGCHATGGTPNILLFPRLCLLNPKRFSDAEATPLLCAGAIDIAI